MNRNNAEDFLFEVEDERVDADDACDEAPTEFGKHDPDPLTWDCKNCGRECKI